MDNYSSHLANHPSEETLEEYVLHRLSPIQCDDLEDHLLLCETCRARLQEAESFVQAMRQAGTRIREAEFFRLNQAPIWRRALSYLGEVSSPGRFARAGGFAIAILAVVLILPRLRTNAVEYEDVRLMSVRGSESAAKPKPNSWLRLHLDTQRLDSYSGARIVLVDANGHKVWQSEPRPGDPSQSELVVTLERKLASGNYWVRLSSEPDGKLLREYPLKIQ